MENEETRRIINFFSDCLKDSPPIAPLDKIEDSQTQKVISYIRQNFDSPRIMDYGCGKFRLLNALHNHLHDKGWRYLGVDIYDPKLQHRTEYNYLLKTHTHTNNWSVSKVDVRPQANERFNLIILMNVIHETSIRGLAEAIETIRLHLDDNGRLILIDTLVLPEGEPHFLPFYDWELTVLFGEHEDLSYQSQSGIPILFWSIPKKSIPCYHFLPSTLYDIVEGKRDTYASIGNFLKSDKSKMFARRMGLGRNQLHDFLYINTMCSTATYRLLQYSRTMNRLEVDNFEPCAVEVLQFLHERFINAKRPRIIDIYDAFGTKYMYTAIQWVLDALMRCDPYGAMRPVRTCDEELLAFELLELVVDNIAHIPTRGFYRVLDDAKERLAKFTQ